MIGKILVEGTDKLKEMGIGKYAEKGAETGSTLKINRQYMD